MSLTTGDLPPNIPLTAGQSIRANAADNAFEAFTPGAGTVTSVGLTSTDFSVSGSPVTGSGSITANLNTSGVTAGNYDRVTVSNKGIVTVGTNASFSFGVSRSLNTAFQISTTQNALVNYAIDISVTSVLLAGTQGTVTLQIADDSAFTTNVKTVLGGTSATGGVLNVSNIGTVTVSGPVPAGKYAKIVTANTTGSPTFSYRTGNETLL